MQANVGFAISEWKWRKSIFEKMVEQREAVVHFGMQHGSGTQALVHLGKIREQGEPGIPS